MMGSNDGFLHLKRKERKKLPRYRSGTWKHHAMKRLKGAYVKDSVEAFHDIDHRNVVVSFGGSKTKALAVSGPVFDRDLCRLDDDHEHTWVLINAGHGGFLRVSRKSYVKLCRIDRVYMQQRLFVKGDEDEDEHEVYRIEHVITDIGELAYQIIHRFHGMDGIYDMQAECCGFSIYRPSFRIMVIRRDNEVETWNDDMSGFLHRYGIE